MKFVTRGAAAYVSSAEGHFVRARESTCFINERAVTWDEAVGGALGRPTLSQTLHVVPTPCRTLQSLAVDLVPQLSPLLVESVQCLTHQPQRVSFT